MFRSLLRHSLALSALALLAQGCIFVSDDDPGDGTLTVEWSIDGYADPVDCDVNRVDWLELAIYDGADQFVTEIEAPCDDFGVSVDLPDGVYTFDATLVDGADRAATTTLTLSVDVVGGTELVVPINFPARSFL